MLFISLYAVMNNIGIVLNTDSACVATYNNSTKISQYINYRNIVNLFERMIHNEDYYEYLKQNLIMIPYKRPLYPLNKKEIEIWITEFDKRLDLKKLALPYLLYSIQKNVQGHFNVVVATSNISFIDDHLFDKFNITNYDVVNEAVAMFHDWDLEWSCRITMRFDRTTLTISYMEPPNKLIVHIPLEIGLKTVGDMNVDDAIYSIKSVVMNILSKYDHTLDECQIYYLGEIEDLRDANKEFHNLLTREFNIARMTLSCIQNKETGLLNCGSRIKTRNNEVMNNEDIAKKAAKIAFNLN